VPSSDGREHHRKSGADFTAETATRTFRPVRTPERWWNDPLPLADCAEEEGLRLLVQDLMPRAAKGERSAASREPLRGPISPCWRTGSFRAEGPVLGHCRQRSLQLCVHRRTRYVDPIDSITASIVVRTRQLHSQRVTSAKGRERVPNGRMGYVRCRAQSRRWRVDGRPPAVGERRALPGRVRSLPVENATNSGDAFSILGVLPVRLRALPSTPGRPTLVDGRALGTPASRR
jgi:hypothetical protein